MTLALRPARPMRIRRSVARHDAAWRFRALTRLLTVAVAGLLAWIVVLGVSLPATDGTRQWRLLWIGFDTAEVVALGVTLWAVYRSRLVAIPAALIAGTLFACDAWFDVVLSWGTRESWFSVGTAVFVELPLAAVLWSSAGSMAREVMARSVLRQLGASQASRRRPTTQIDDEAGATSVDDFATLAGE